MFRQWFVVFLIIGASAQAKQATVKKPLSKAKPKIQTPVQGTAASTPAESTKTTPAMTTAKPTPKSDRSASRNGLVLDYNSWFENIRILGGTPYETKALLYGIGLSYEYNLLRTSWGWGIGGGIIHGYAVSGDSSDTTSYYAKRVPLEIGRVSGRIFHRVNPRFDIGLLSSLLYTLTNWPESYGLTVEKPGSVMMGAFLDTRWRLDGHWELIQALGTFNRGPSLAWRLGTTYTF